MTESSVGKCLNALRRAFDDEPQLRNDTEALLRLVVDTYRPPHLGSRFLPAGLPDLSQLATKLDRALTPEANMRHPGGKLQL